MTDFQPGDRVRVSYETTIHYYQNRRVDTYPGAIAVNRPATPEMSPGVATFVPAEFVELIEPVDDPSKDPLLTVRVHPEDNPSEPRARRAIKLDRGSAGWALFRDGEAAYWTVDQDVRGWNKQSAEDVHRAVNGVETVPDAPEVVRVRTDKDGEQWFELNPNQWTWGGMGNAGDEAYRYAARQDRDDADLVDRPTSELWISTYAPFSEPFEFEVPAS